MSIYYNPEDANLTLVASHELDEEPYNFNLVCVWKHNETGEYYWGADAGCSCPSPFEDFHSASDLEPLRNPDPVVSRVQRCANKSGLQDFIWTVRSLTERCPRCEKGVPEIGDYLCHGCRFGV